MIENQFVLKHLLKVVCVRVFTVKVRLDQQQKRENYIY